MNKKGVKMHWPDFGQIMTGIIIFLFLSMIVLFFIWIVCQFAGC